MLFPSIKCSSTLNQGNNFDNGYLILLVSYLTFTYLSQNPKCRKILQGCSVPFLSSLISLVKSLRLYTLVMANDIEINIICLLFTFFHKILHCITVVTWVAMALTYILMVLCWFCWFGPVCDFFQVVLGSEDTHTHARACTQENQLFIASCQSVLCYFYEVCQSVFVRVFSWEKGLIHDVSLKPFIQLSKWVEIYLTQCAC